MTPINEVPVGKFCRFEYSVVYMCYNNFKDRYTLIPIENLMPRDKGWNHKVYVYKRIKKEWVVDAKEQLIKFLGWQAPEGSLIVGIDNLTYVENLAILKSYEF